MRSKNISIIGFMGSGKSTVGRILSGKSNFLFIDLDNIIELSEESLISSIFARKGEKYFRDVESSVIRNIYKNKNCIFACGGGVVTRRENMELIKDSSLIVYLEISPDEASRRLKRSKNRPLIKTGDPEKKIKDLFRERKLLYEKYADMTFKTDSTGPSKLADAIFKKIKSAKSNEVNKR